MCSHKNRLITHHKTESRPKLSQICSYGSFSKGLKILALKNEIETAVVKETSAFEALKVYCAS